MFLKNKKTISKLFTYGDKTIYKRPYHILISKNKGEAGNDIDIRVNYYGSHKTE